MRKLTFVVIITGMIFLGAAAGVIITQPIRTQSAFAQAEQRISAQSLGITRGQYLVADLTSFPDGATKLVLRDRNGKVGLILAVHDRPDSARAQIEFYDSGGKIVRTLDAASVAAPSDAQGGRTTYSLTPTESRRLQDQIDDLRGEIGKVRELVSKP